MESSFMNTSCEPMDVDLSANSGTIILDEPEETSDQPEVSEASPQKIERESVLWNVKKYHIKRDTKSVKTNQGLMYLVVGLLVIFLSIIIYCILNIKCINTLDLNELKIKLEKNLYGQQKAVDSLLKSLGEDFSSKIIFLYGGTGVGKTFAVSLALGNFWNSSNVYHYTMPSFVNTFSTETLLGLNVCESSIVVVDDLKQNDFHVKRHIAEVIRKSEDLNKKITIILVYNCDEITRDFVKKCDDTFYLNLRQVYDDIDAYKSFIKFETLTAEVLKKCIEDELKGRSIYDVDFDSILSNFDVTLDGCKGVYKKIKFLNML